MDAVGDRSNGYATGRARREQLIDAAIAAFGESGFHTATLGDIAAACGISRPGLLHHFDSKEALLTAVLERRDAIDREAFTGAIARSVSPLQAIVDITASNAETAGLIQLYAVLSAEATNPAHPAHDYFAGLYRRLTDDVADTLRPLVDDGTVAGPADELARELLALRDGLVLQSLLSRGRIRPTEALAAAITRLTGVEVTAR